MGNIPKRVAIVYDWVDKWGGAEQILLSLHEIFPSAPLFTLFYDPQKAVWARKFDVRVSFLQPFSFLPRQILIAFAPLAFEAFNFSDFDLVISVSSHFGHGVIVKNRHYHICLTPARYLYLNSSNYQVFGLFKPFEKIVKKYLIYWDSIASRRPDKIFAISQTVQKRILDFWGLKSEVLYPPVKTPQCEPAQKDSFFLFLGRLEKYKNPELIVKVFNQLKLPLVVAGAGSQLFRIKSIAKSNVQILGEVSEEKKWALLRQAKAVIFYHEEDFGLVPVEAMSVGTPVIGLNRGGASETVIHGKTGFLLDKISPEQLKQAIINFDPDKYNPSDLVKQAQKFSYESFIRTCSVWR